MTRRALFTCPVISVEQPIGTFYVTSMEAADLARITEYDVRRLIEAKESEPSQNDTDLDQYIGIQRAISAKRVTEIAEYVETLDATFPTSIVIAIQDDRSVMLSDDKTSLTFYDVDRDEYGEAVPAGRLARILDGQHRLAGLEKAGRNFQLSVTVFPALDIADQAYVFSTVNLAQTKVNKSLVYDLFAYARTRSPQKTSHNVAVVLNRAKESPFYEKIKRLGSATPGVPNETLTQATFVQGVIQFISEKYLQDRDALLRGKPLKRADWNQFQVTPFRNLFIEERDETIANAVWTYFDSVKRRWPIAWDVREGQMLLRTNGYRAFSSLMGKAYVAVGGRDTHEPGVGDYMPIWDLVKLDDEDFNTARFLPGTSGDRALFRLLEAALRIYKTQKS